jgi:hypothetical protein
MAIKRTGREIACLKCGKKVYIPASRVKQNARYCSVTCASADRLAYRRYKRTGVQKLCEECRRPFYQYPSYIRATNRQRCSKACANKYIQRLYKGDKQRSAQLAQLRKLLPSARTKTHRERLSITGKKLVADGKRSYFIKTGAENPAWKGGIATEQNRLRSTPEYGAWRKAVYERDGYKCRHCGTGKNLHAHHIKEFSTHPELRYVVSNGLTLCRACHSKHHSRYIPNIGSVNKRSLTSPREAA